MDRIPDCQQWSQVHFGAADLGDPRRAKRLVASAAAIAAQPEKSFPSVFDWNELRAFYNLCGRDEATLQALQRPHWELTRAAMAREPSGVKARLLCWRKPLPRWSPIGPAP